MEIEQEAFLHVTDRLVGLEGFELGVGLAQGVGLAGEGEEIGGAGEVEDADGFENSFFRICRAILATVVAFQGEDLAIG